MNSSIDGYVPQDSEEKALYLRDFLDDVGIGIGQLYTFFHSDGFSSLPLEAIARERVRFLGTLSRVESLEQEFEALSGNPHSSYHTIAKRLNDLIKRTSGQINYRNAQRISLN